MSDSLYTPAWLRWKGYAVCLLEYAHWLRMLVCVCYCLLNSRLLCALLRVQSCSETAHIASCSFTQLTFAHVMAVCTVVNGKPQGSAFGH